MNKLYAIGVLLVGLGWWVMQADDVLPESSNTDRSVGSAIQPRIDFDQVKLQLHRLRTVLHQYNIESGNVPSGFAEVVDAGAISWDDVTDPWGRTFAYRSQMKRSSAFVEEYEIFVYSLGPDGTPDNSDDIYL